MSKLSDTFDDVCKGLKSRGWRNRGGGRDIAYYTDGKWNIKVWLELASGVIKVAFMNERTLRPMEVQSCGVGCEDCQPTKCPNSVKVEVD